MKLTPLVPPIKCQGIKTKLVKDVKNIVSDLSFGRWIEPFSGSGVVAFNINPKKALLADTNTHIIQFYNNLKNQFITSKTVKLFLQENGQVLKEQGESYYYQVRERFNQSPNSLDFLFLNRSCFNGVMRFNRKGQFNVPYCHKSERFSQAYITKIVNQVIALENILIKTDYNFQVADFRETLSDWQKTDLIYLDPPYLGRHTDYFNSWSQEDEDCLVTILKDISCRFILSTWHSNQFRSNPLIKKNWSADKFYIYTKQHFYHVGSTEKLRHPITEALITNFNIPLLPERGTDLQQLSLLPSTAENEGVRTV